MNPDWITCEKYLMNRTLILMNIGVFSLASNQCMKEFSKARLLAPPKNTHAPLVQVRNPSSHINDADADRERVENALWG